MRKVQEHENQVIVMDGNINRSNLEGVNTPIEGGTWKRTTINRWMVCGLNLGWLQGSIPCRGTKKNL